MSVDANQNMRTPYAMPADLHSFGIPAGALDDITHLDQMHALCAASDMADSYLRDQYETPLSSWAYDLRRAVCFIAAYDIISRRGYNPEGDNGTFRVKYEDAISWLKDVARGHASLAGGRVKGPLTLGGPVITSAPSRGW